VGDLVGRASSLQCSILRLQERRNHKLGNRELNGLQLDAGPLSTDPLDVERAAVNLKPVCPVRSCLGCSRNSQARPYGYTGLFVVEPSNQRHRAITLKRLSPERTL
jgi:hypothetical protein